MKSWNKLRSSIKEVILPHSLKQTFAIFMVVAIIVPILIGGMTSYMISKQTIKDEVSNFNKSWIAKQKDYLELLLQDVESLMDNIANIDSITDALDTETSSSDTYTNLSTQATIGYILSGYNIKGLVSIDLFSLKGQHYHVGDTLDFQNIDTVTKEKLYQIALKSASSVTWVGYTSNININSTHKNAVTAVKLIKKFDPVTLKDIPVGLLIINYDLDSLYEHFANGNFNPNSVLMIVDSEGHLLFHPEKTLIGSQASKSFLDLLTGENGAFTQTMDGQEMFIVYCNSINYGWRVLSYIPVTILTEKATPIRNFTIGVALICLLFILGYAYILSKRVLKPINNMTELFQEIGKNTADLNTRLKVETKDEIGELVKWFNAFMDSLAEKKIVEDKLRIVNEELEMRVKDRTIELESLNALLNQDIAKRKTVEEMLAKRTEEIEETLEKLRATQNQLIQREKLAGIGQLAAGVAHEINNPLGYVLSNVSSLEKYVAIFASLLKMYQKLRQQMTTSPSEDIQLLLNQIGAFEEEKSMDYILNDLEELFSDVNTGLERVQKIVTSLRVFSWMSKDVVYEVYDLNKGIETTLLIAQNEIKYYATVERKLTDIPLISAIGSEINQVLLNIIVNAAHAIRDKEKDKDIDDFGVIAISTTHDAEYVYCRIEDNGIGITQEHLSNIFNPFFTTKPVGEGTGLGLSISYEIIVNQHHGDIFVESDMGVGTVFTIELPIKQITVTE